MESQGAELGRRVGEIRKMVYGEEGSAALARSLGIPERTWANYERGVVMPAEVLLQFIEATGALPRWLLTGRGDPLGGRPFASRWNRFLVD